MRTTLACIALIASVGALALPASQSETYRRGQAAWSAGEYREAYRALSAHRAEPFGRRAEVDYLLATSACRLDAAKRAWGRATLERLPYTYAISRAARDVVTAERARCRDVAPQVSALPPGAGLIAAGMEAAGKTFYWVDRKVPVNSYPARRLGVLDASTLTQRLHAVAAPEPALARARERVSAIPLGVSSSAHSAHFAVVSSAGHAAEDLRDILRQLEAYHAFLVTRFGVEPAPDLMTVYLTRDVGELQKLARAVHLLDVAPSTIGYAYADDLSLVAVVPGQLIGTLFHELTHMLVRGRYGDIPLWLDEGLAALYEVSTLRCGEVLGEPNWRGRVLDELWSQRPPLRQLVTMEWFPADLPQEYSDQSADADSIRQQAVAMATARYWMLELQERGELGALFARMRDLAWTEEPVATQVARAVEAALGVSLDDADARFAVWFRAVNERGLPRTTPPCDVPPERIEKELPPAAPGPAAP